LENNHLIQPTLTSLPNLPRAKINDLNSLFYNFIWNGKSDKIKRSTLIGDIYQEGLKMIDLSGFRGEDFSLIDQSETRIDCADHVC
jgi:hypothetical protein